MRGLDINGNHIRSVNKGVVTARATLIHKGKRTHVSEIKIIDRSGQLLNISRMTNIIIDKIKKN